MTTTTDRLDRAANRRRWSDDLAAAHTEARDKWAKAAADTAGELRAFADFLHELDVPGLVAIADDLAGERLSETAEWPMFAELPEREWKPDDPPVLPPIPDWAYPPGAVPLEPTAVLPAEPDLEMGREIRAALSRPALTRGTYTPDKPAKTAGEYMGQADIEGEPWQKWLRRSLGDLWKQVWPR